MDNHNELIAQWMRSAAENHFTEHELKQLTLDFIQFKKTEGFSFGQLTKMHYEMFGGLQHEDIDQACAAVETMILALDIFDDLQDQDATDKPWCSISQAISMNIATGILMLSTKMMEETPFDRKWDAVRYINHQVLKAVQGQHLDLQQKIQNEEDYVKMAHDKSGSLMACACLVGVALATTDYHDVVQEYATNFGIAAQIQNDIQDVLRGDTKNDLLYKKRTLPILKLLEENHEQANLARDFYNGDVDQACMYDNKIKLLDWIRNSSSITYVQVLKRVFQRKTIQQIEELDTIAKNTKKRQKLLNMIEQL